MNVTNIKRLHVIVHQYSIRSQMTSAGTKQVSTAQAARASKSIHKNHKNLPLSLTITKRLFSSYSSLL